MSPSAGADLISLQRLAGNQAVVQLIGTPTLQREPVAAEARDVDPRQRVDRLQLAIAMDLLNKQFRTDVDKAAEALAGITAEDGRAIKAEYKRRTSFELGWVLTGQQTLGEDGPELGTNLGMLDRRRLLNLLSGTVAAPVDPAHAQVAGDVVGGIVATAAAVTGHGEDAERLGQQASQVVASGVAAEEAKQASAAAANRYRAEATQMRQYIEKGQGEAAIKLIRRPDAEKQAMADQYQALYGESLYNALVAKLKGRDGERAAALWIGDTVAADRIALEVDLEHQRAVEKAARDVEDSWAATLTNPAAKEIARRQRAEAKVRVEARLSDIAESDHDDSSVGRAKGSEHLATVLQGPADPSATAVPGTAAPGTAATTAGSATAVTPETLGSRVAATGDSVAKAIIERGEPEELAARLARADVDGKLKAGELESGLRRLRVMARTAAVREIEGYPAMAPLGEVIIGTVTFGYYQRFQQRFDQDDTKRSLDKALSIGDDAQEARNRALLAAEGSLPTWRELELALRQDPKDMDRVRLILNDRNRDEIATLKQEYHEGTQGKRSLETDLLGTRQEQAFAAYRDRDEAAEDLAEKQVLLQGGVFQSESSDEATRLDEERKWTFGRYLALERAVMQNRGTFAELRDWVGNLEHGLVEIAHRDATDASVAMARALTDVPPDLTAARAALVELHRATDRIESNLSIYKEATKAAFNEFVDLAVLAVTTIVTLGEGTAVMLAIRGTVATVGTKLVLKGNDYSVDEFLMDLRSNLGGAVGGKLAEGLLKPIASKIAAYATSSGLSRTFAGKVGAYVGKAAKWETENVITTGTTNVFTGQELGAGLDWEGHKKALAQHAVTSTLKAGRGKRPAGAREDGAAGTTQEERPTAAGAGRTGAAEEATTRIAPEAEGHAGRPVSEADSAVRDPWDQAASVTEDGPTAAAEDEIPDRPAPTSMALPEHGKGTGPRTGRAQDEAASGAAEASEAPPEPVLDVGDTTRPDIPVVETRRQKHDREAQEAHARKNPLDEASLRSSTNADERARAMAQEFAPIYAEWADLHPVERLARLEAVMNSQLLAAGAPLVHLNPGAHEPGNAAFNVEQWTVSVSSELINAHRLTPERFAQLAENIAHEGRHALHHFRGLRAALQNQTFVADSRLTPAAKAVEAARVANAAEPVDLQAPAFAEGLEVYDQTFGAGAEDRLRVKRSLRTARASRIEAQAAADEAARNFGEGSPERRAADEALVDARRREVEAHNRYVALPQETDAHRRGMATGKAVLERLQAQRVQALWQARRRSAAEQRRLQRRLQDVAAAGGDQTAAQEAVDRNMERYRRLSQDLRAARGRLEELQRRTPGRA